MEEKFGQNRRHPLPATALDYIKEQFREDYMIDEIMEEKDKTGQPQYRVTLDQGTTRFNLVFNHSGSLTSRESQDLSPDDYHDDYFHEDGSHEEDHLG